ncbi:branched-chain amino acid ABC transporter permease, partial [Microbacterium sp. zg.Y909]
MDRLAFLLATGLARGAIFALFALSLVLIWRAARIINFAQGAMALVATYLAFAVTALTGSYAAGLAAGVLGGAAMGFVVERGLMRHAPHRSPLAGIIIAIGLVMVLQSLLGIFFGPQYRPMAAPFDETPIFVGGVPLLSPYDLFVLVVALSVMGILALLFTRTSLGLQLRASAFAPEVSRLLGVRVDRMVTIGWMLSAAVAALAALLLIPTELGLNP